MNKKEFSFEKSMERLEEISKLIQDKEMSLEESAKLYEESIELYGLCSKYLDEKEMSIKVINE